MFSAHSSSVWLKSRRTASVWSGANVAQVSQSLNRTAVGDGARVAGAHSSSVWLSVHCQSVRLRKRPWRAAGCSVFLMGLRVWKLIVAQVSQSSMTAVGEWVMAVRCQMVSEWLSAQLSSLSGCLRVTLAGGRNAQGSEVAQGCSGCFKPNSGRS